MSAATGAAATGAITTTEVVAGTPGATISLMEMAVNAAPVAE